ncbi:Tubulin-specific chaperone E [Clonorchis sinensis]|uniref:Tubulin-specific chaperone E n=1 Tax=Clonorchis sinensis TaxID=79923 RepID=A0A8T1MFJ2_CLOSI|nr:Tubulin-specific chaperone E [Clonorchis sinensis]
MCCGPQGAETALKYLRTATFTLVPIYRALHGPPSPEKASLWPQLGGTLGHYLPNLTELDLSGCLVSRWKEVAEIGIQLPWLKSLNLSSNHLRLPLLLAIPIGDAETGDAEQTLRVKYDLDTHPTDEKLFSQAFPNVCCLVLVRSLFLDWPSLLRIIKWMPSLKSLAVAYNQLGNLPTNLDVDTVHAFHRLVELDLTATGTSELGYLFSILGPSTVLDTLLLGQNPIAVFPELPVSPEAVQSDDPFAPSIWFQALHTLNMRNTAFTNWHPIKQLLRLHRLEQLTFSDCPVLEDLTIETARQELIARLPHVSCINRIQVCPDERRGAELDYLKRYGAVWRSLGGAPTDTGPGPADDKNAITMSSDFAQDHPVFVKLCSKWGVPDDGESKLITRSLKEGLMNITFVLEDPNNKNVSPTVLSSSSPQFVNQKELTRRIHGRMTVGHLRMMVRRLFKIPAKSSFDLVAQGERHRKINTEVALDSDTREFGFYCLEDGDKIYVRIHA